RLLSCVLFPYTTLFRSHWVVDRRRNRVRHRLLHLLRLLHRSLKGHTLRVTLIAATKTFDNNISKALGFSRLDVLVDDIDHLAERSEEHTSELQSRENLV